MLTQHKVLEGKLVHAWLETAHREDGRPTDERLVIDESDDVVGSVSDQYRLVRNADIISALDLEAEKRALVLEPSKAAYHNGRSFYTLNAPAHGFRVPGDKSDIFPSVIVRNDYRGGGGLKIQSGLFRLVCTNGLIIGDVLYAANQRHVGSFNLRLIIGKALDSVLDTLAVQKLLAERATTVPEDLAVVEAIIADTAERYRDDMRYQIDNYRAELGPNMWAVAQAVADLATHRLQRRADGAHRARFNMGADDWAARQWRRIAETVEA